MADRKDVLTVVEYTLKDGTAKSRWTKVGSAWTNRDGSLSITLDALPINGKLQVRDPLPPRDGRGGTSESRRGAESPPTADRGASFDPDEDTPF